MELSTDYQKFGLKIKHRLSTDYQKSENSQLVTFLLRCLYTILSVVKGNFDVLYTNNDEPAKIWHFQFSESIFEVKNQLPLLENDFLI